MTDEKLDDDTMIPVINDQARIQGLQCKSKRKPVALLPNGNQPTPTQAPGEQVVLLPGINYVSLGLLRETGILDENGRAYNGLVRVQDPTKLETFEAFKLAEGSNSRRALEEWSRQDERQPVRDAISRRLTKIQGKAA